MNMRTVNKDNFYWTEHAKIKLRQYRLSEARVKRVLRFPKRREVGVAPETVAGMQPAGSKQHPYEIWVMWEEKIKKRKEKGKIEERNFLKKNFLDKNKIKIISVWKYPGKSPVREPPPIPEEVWEMVRKNK